MTNTTTTQVYNIRTGRIIGSWESRWLATQICRSYNDMAGRNAFNTRTLHADRAARKQQQQLNKESAQ
jgi:hypothetical protein